VAAQQLTHPLDAVAEVEHAADQECDPFEGPALVFVPAVGGWTAPGILEATIPANSRLA